MCPNDGPSLPLDKQLRKSRRENLVTKASNKRQNRSAYITNDILFCLCMLSRAINDRFVNNDLFFQGVAINRMLGNGSPRISSVPRHIQIPFRSTYLRR